MKRVDLLREVGINGVKLTKEQKEAFIVSYEEAIKKFVGEGESVRTALGTFSKKHKEQRNNPERTVTLHGVERVIPASVTPAKDVLGFKTKVEF